MNQQIVLEFFILLSPHVISGKRAFSPLDVAIPLESWLISQPVIDFISRTTEINPQTRRSTDKGADDHTQAHAYRRIMSDIDEVFKIVIARAEAHVKSVERFGKTCATPGSFQGALLASLTADSFSAGM